VKLGQCRLELVPLRDSSYSTRSGGPEITVRSTIPRDSSSFIRSDSNRSDNSGTDCAISEKRSGPSISTRRIAPVHRRPTNSTASW